jgi:hypothetical protein
MKEWEEENNGKGGATARLNSLDYGGSFFGNKHFSFFFLYKIKLKIEFFFSLLCVCVCLCFVFLFPSQIVYMRHGPAGRPSPTGSWSSLGRREFCLRKFGKLEEKKEKEKTEENCGVKKENE